MEIKKKRKHMINGKISYERHLLIAAKLYEYRNFFHEVLMNDVCFYRKSESLSRSVYREQRKIDALRSMFEDKFFKEYPKEATVKVYFPNSRT